MAATQYQIFCKYLNENTNKIVSNSSEKEWISAQTWYQSKVAYNVTDKEASNVMTIAVASPNSGKAAGSTYREVYDILKNKMKAIDPNTGTRLRYFDLSVEEQKVYDICDKYLDIIDKISKGECVIEYAMIRPYDELKVVTPIKTSTTDSHDYYHGGHTQRTSGKIYKPTQVKELIANAKLLDSELSKIIYEQINTSENEKYNMLFTFAGMVQTDEQVDGWICGGSLNRVSSFNYKLIKDDNVYIYQSAHWHSDGGQGKPGTTIPIGQAPIKSFNATFSVPTVTGGSGGVTLQDVTFGDADKEVCHAVYEGMERLQVQPWFLIATCNSLKAAMTKVEQLIDIYGKDAVKLGKVVPLEQYIEIV